MVDLEISHHYGLERFAEHGVTMLNIVNREYAKKLLIILAGQTNPEHYHERKEETFHVLYGEMDLTLDGTPSKLRAGDVQTDRARRPPRFRQPHRGRRRGDLDDALRAGLLLHGPQHPGHGRSQDVRDALDGLRPTVVWDVDDVLNDLMAAWLAQVWVSEHPDRPIAYADVRANPPHELLRHRSRRVPRVPR